MMALDLHQKIRAYLRQYGKKDMGGFHLDWVGGQTSIGRWDYQDVPQPTNDSLNAVEQQHLDYEMAPVQTRDIYKATITDAPAGTGWVVFPLVELRRPDVTELVAPNSIQLSKGYWEIKLEGISRDAFTLQIVRNNGAPIYQQNCLGGRFRDQHLFYAEGNIEIRVKARRSGRENILDPDFTIVLEPI